MKPGHGPGEPGTEAVADDQTNAKSKVLFLTSASPRNEGSCALESELERWLLECDERLAPRVDLVHQYVISRIGHGPDAEQATKDVFASALRRLRRDPVDEEDLSALLVRMARRKTARWEASRRPAASVWQHKFEARIAEHCNTLVRLSDSDWMVEAKPSAAAHYSRQQPDPQRSSAVVIAASQYKAPRGGGALPGVDAGAEAFVRLLADRGIKHTWAVTGSAATTGNVTQTVQRAASAAQDFLLVYYAGHGLVDYRGELVFGTADTDPNQLDSGVRFAQLRDLTRHSPAGRVLFILDCCYAGRAGRGLDERIGTPAGREGSEREEYVLAATGPGNYALTGTSESVYTAFTGALLEVLANGVAGGPEQLDLPTVYGALRSQLAAEGLPTPHLGARGGRGGGALSFGPNPRATRGAPRHAANDKEAARLMRAAGDGDQEAWNTLVDRYARLVWSTVRALGIEPDAAGDVCQTVWLRLVEDMACDRVSPGALAAWLTTTAQAQALDALRARSGEER